MITQIDISLTIDQDEEISDEDLRRELVKHLEGSIVAEKWTRDRRPGIRNLKTAVIDEATINDLTHF